MFAARIQNQLDQPDLIRFYVDSPRTGNSRVPAVLAPIEALSEAQARRTRIFTLAMSGMVHTINGRFFDPG